MAGSNSSAAVLNRSPNAAGGSHGESARGCETNFTPPELTSIRSRNKYHAAPVESAHTTRKITPRMTLLTRVLSLPSDKLPRDMGYQPMLMASCYQETLFFECTPH